MFLILPFALWMIFPSRLFFISFYALQRMVNSGMQSGTLTSAGLQYSRSLAEYLSTEQKIDLEGCGKEMLVLTGAYHACYRLCLIKHWSF